jgi:hypothetical protein
VWLFVRLLAFVHGCILSGGSSQRNGAAWIGSGKFYTHRPQAARYRQWTTAAAFHIFTLVIGSDG